MANNALTLDLEPTPPVAAPAAAARRRSRVRRATAGQRAAATRVTSFQLGDADEVLLDALREAYGTTVTGQAIRRALRDAARVKGLDVDRIEREAGAV